MAAVLAALAVVLLSPHVAPPPFALYDHGTLVSQYHAVWNGAVPHRDFADNYAGLGHLVAAPVYGILGPRLSSSVWLMAVLAAAVAAAAGRLAKELLPAPLAAGAGFAAGVLITFCCVPFPGWMAVAPALLALSFVARPGPRNVWIAGLLLGLAGSCKQTQGLFGLLAAIQWILWRAADGPVEPGKEERRRWLPVVVTLAALALPALLLLPWLAERTTWLAWHLMATASALLLLARLLRRPVCSSWRGELLRLVAGAAVVPVLLLVYLWSRDALAALVHDQFLRSARPDLTVFQRYPGLNLSSLALGVTLAAVLVALRAWTRGHLSAGRLTLALLTGALLVYGIVFLAQRDHTSTGRLAWNFAFWLPHALCGWHLLRARVRSERFLLALSLGAFHLLTYPNPAVGYLLYALVPVPLALATALEDVLGPRLRWLTFLAAVLVGLGPLTKAWVPKQRLPDDRIDITLTAEERASVAAPVAWLHREQVDADRLLTFSGAHWLFALARGGNPEWFDLQSLLYKAWFKLQPIEPAELEALALAVRRQGIQWVLTEPEWLPLLAPVLGGAFTPGEMVGYYQVLRRR